MVQVKNQKSNSQKMNAQELDRFEDILQNGLIKVCQGMNYLKDGLLESPDLEDKWNEYIKEYIGDAVHNFNDYPEAALAWAAFLGMGVANLWDKNWEKYQEMPYTFYYGQRGWDDMDEHIIYEIIKLDETKSKRLTDTLNSCALACLGLIRHEGIEAQTADGFYCLSRAYTVFFRIGASLELERCAYRKQIIK